MPSFPVDSATRVCFKSEFPRVLSHSSSHGAQFSLHPYGGSEVNNNRDEETELELLHSVFLCDHLEFF